ncbi:MAG: ADP-ribosyltransferase [Bacteroides sp.]
MYEARQHKSVTSRVINKSHVIHHLMSRDNNRTIQNINKNCNVQVPIVQKALKGKWFEKLSPNEQDALKSLEAHPISKLLSTEQIGAFSSYTGFSFDNINKYLRNVKSFKKLKRYKVSAGSLNLEHDRKCVFYMQQAFNKAPITIPSQITVYRGCDKFLMDEKGNKLLQDVNSLVKKTIVEPAFLSTSANINHAKKFAKKVLLIITVPAGTHAFYVTKELENRSSSEKLRDEDEIIFEPKQRMNINSVEKKENILFLKVDMLSSHSIPRALPPLNQTSSALKTKNKQHTNSKTNKKILPFSFQQNKNISKKSRSTALSPIMKNLQSRNQQSIPLRDVSKTKRTFPQFV